MQKSANSLTKFLKPRNKSARMQIRKKQKMKQMYYLEICDTDYICGSIYPLGVMTEKQAIKEAERRIKELWRSNKDRCYNIQFNVCLDEEAFDLVYCVRLWKGDITVYDYRSEEFIKDTANGRICKLLDKIDNQLECIKDLNQQIEYEIRELQPK